MAKRSPWAAQSRRTVKAIRSEFKQFPKDEKLLSVLDIVKRKPQNIPHEEKVSFLLSHSPAFLRALRREGMRVGSLSFHGAENNILLRAARETVLKGNTIDHFLLETAKEIIFDAAPRSDKMFSRGLKSYLEKRNIPFNKKIFEKSVERFMRLCPLEETVSGKISLTGFEQFYLKNLKEEREMKMVGASINNTLIKQVFRGVRLTPNQRRAAKRWLVSHHDEVFSIFNQRVVGKNLAYDRAHAEVEKVIEELAGRMRAELLPSFIQNNKSSHAVQGNGILQQKKIGNRQERINNHVKEDNGLRARNQVVQEKERAATISGAPFDSVSFCLQELKKQNPLVAERFNQFVKSGTLGAGSLKSLYTSGSLAQKTFLTAVDKTGFVSVFGEKQLGPLARFVAFVGPGGRQIPHAKRAMQSAKSEEIYRFLEKNKLIETQHVGGSVVYLARQ